MSKIKLNKIKLYKFCGKSEHAISTIQNKEIKVTTNYDINDPFEIIPLSLPNKEQRIYVEKHRKRFFEKAGIISFSKIWSHPMMWSHYGDNHRGLCLGFDINLSDVFEVQYVRKLPVAKSEISDDGKNNLILSCEQDYVATKFADWKYEKEYRMIVPLEGNTPKPSTLLFFPYSSTMELKQVIIGPRSIVTIEDVEDALNDNTGVEIFQSRLAFHSFEVTRQKNKNRWNRRRAKRILK